MSKVFYELVKPIRNKKQCLFVMLLETDSVLPVPFIQNHLNLEVIIKPVDIPSLNESLRILVSQSNKKQSDFRQIEGKNILIVEDHDFNRLLLIKALQEYGCKTFEAENGKELFEILAEVNPDIILLDLHMPIMDGYKTCEKIRSRTDRFKDIPIIIMTADIISLDEKKIEDIGANDIIYKPIDLDLIREKIGSHTQASTLITSRENESITSSILNLDELYEEYQKLINEALFHLGKNDIAEMKHSLHQLKGVIGLSENLPLILEVNQLTSDLANQQLKQQLLNIQKLIVEEYSHLNN